MSEFNTAIVVLFGGLGLAALAIGLLARRTSTSAVGVGLTGLLALTTASTWITAAGPVTDTAQLAKYGIDNAHLKTTIAKQKAELEDARRRALEQPPKAEFERLNGELQAERSKSVEAKQMVADANRKGAAATARVAELDDKVLEAQKGKVEAERKLEVLEQKLRGVQPAPAPPRPPDIPGIRRKLAEGDPPFYAIQAERDLIPGKRGTWYVVRLLQNKRDWDFADRQFVLADASEIKASAAHLRDDVLLPLSQAKLSWRLFVRGTADARPVAGPVGREIAYLPHLSGGTYSPEPRRKEVTFSVQNNDLPTLRANWLREIIRPVLSAVETSDIEILENPPQPGNRRTAEIVLFVEW